MIAVSLAWGEGKAAAFLVNHRDIKGNWEEILEPLRELLAMPVKKTFHNYKYDYKVLTEHQGIPVKNVGWDSLAGEYLLDENKAGHYGLKELTRERVPEFADYETILKTAVKGNNTVAITKARLLKMKEHLVPISETIKTMAEGINSLKVDISDLVIPRLLDAKGPKNPKINSTYEKNAAFFSSEMTYKEWVHLKAALKRLQDEIKVHRGTKARCNSIAKRWRQRKSEAEEKAKTLTFEDIPVREMLLYAAIDADCTLRISKQQIREMTKEDTELNIAMQNVMIPGAEVLGRMEHEGVNVDQEYLTELEETFSKLVISTQREIYQHVGREFNINSTAQLETVLIFDLGLKLTVKTAKSGAFKLNNDVLESLADKHPLIKKIIEHRAALRAKNTFLKGIRNFSQFDGRVHANYNATVAATGRLCIAKGTKIEVVRDLSKHPKGINIEDVKVGDYVYCYNSKLELCLQKVKWAGKTGKKKVVRLHWMGQGRKHTGHLDLTPEHRVRTINGKYTQAKNLKINQSVMALGRSLTGGYSRLHTRNKEIRDHRFIFNEVYGYFPEHVHHDDENKLNNTLSNLEGMTAEDHCRAHTTKMMNTPERKEQSRKQAIQFWKEGKFKARAGDDASNYIKTTRFSLLKELAKNGSKPTKCKAITKCFTVFKKKCLEHGLVVSEIFKRYDNEGNYISRGKVKRTLGMKKYDSYTFLKVGHYRYEELLEFYGLERTYKKPSNHIIKEIEYLDTKVDVYDLEVEDSHNFIANEICVHNSSSSPNMQNVPYKMLGINIKKLFIPDNEDEEMFDADYSGAEIRVLTAYAADKDLIQSLNDGLNIHSFVASEVFGEDYDEIQNRDLIKESNPQRYEYLDNLRQVAKTMVFLTIYGGGAQTLYNDLVKADSTITLEDCEMHIRKFLNKFPIIEDYMREIKMHIDVHSFVKTQFGRRRRFPLAGIDWKLKNASYREGINMPIQSTSSDLVVDRLIRLNKLRDTVGMKLRITVHDSFVASYPKENRSLIRPFLDKYAEEEIAEKFPWLPVPFIYEASYGPSYGECNGTIKR